MHGDSLMVLPRPARPGSFSGLMALYESNYVRLRWLLPDLGALRHAGTRMVSESPGDFPLYLEVLEAVRYTTTMRLTYFLDSPNGVMADPDLVLRLYHDAGQLEAMACSQAHQHAALRRFAAGVGGELQSRWRRNMMLNKWLEYCADRHHDFSKSAAEAWIPGGSGSGCKRPSSSRIKLAIGCGRRP